MKICALSDIHGYLDFNINPCDVLIIAGDIMPLNIQRWHTPSIQWLHNHFAKWCDDQPCNKVLLVPGNHDIGMERFNYQQFTETHPKIEILVDRLIEIDNKTFYGSPWCQELSRWAFYKSNEDLEEIFSKIPDCDVLITHQPPRVGDVGKVLQKSAFNYGSDFGCIELTEAIKDKNIKFSIAGHVHSAEHNVYNVYNTNFVNVSIKDENYEVTYPPFYFEI